jgi:putative endonuclease
MCYFYILFSPSKDRFYIGQSVNPEKRLAQHIVRKNLGASDWTLAFVRKFENRSGAMAMEKQVKAKKSKNYIRMLIQAHPDGQETENTTKG